MPHVHTLDPHHGESRFARPVAAVTAFVRGLVASHLAPAPRIRQDLEVRDLEERFSRASDHGDLERMERDFNRRDGGGLPMGDWR